MKEEMTLHALRSIESQAWTAYNHGNYECFRSLISFVERRYQELKNLRLEQQIDTRLSDDHLQPIWVFSYRQAAKTIAQDGPVFYHIPTGRIIADYTDFFLFSTTPIDSFTRMMQEAVLARAEFLKDFPEFERRI